MREQRPAGRRVALEDGSVDIDRRLVERGAQAIELRPKEAELLGYLAERAGRTVPREELLSQVFGYRPNTLSRTLDTTIRRLRAAIEPDPSAPRYLVTEIGVGYRFASADPPSPFEEALSTAASQVLERLTRKVPARVALFGPPGCGKRRITQAVAERFPGRVVRVEGPDLALAAASLGLGPDPLHLQARIEAERARSPALLLFDAPDGDRIATFAPPTLSLWLSPPDDPRFEPVRVEPLSEAAALDLLRERARGPVDGAEILLPQLGGLPLAIELAADLLAFYSPAELTRELSQRPERLYEASSGALLLRDLALARLDEAHLSALDALSSLAGPADIELMAEIAGGMGALAPLESAGFLSRTESGRFFVPASLRRESTKEGRARAKAAIVARFARGVDPLCGPLDWATQAALLEALPHLRAHSDDSEVRTLLVWALHLAGHQEELAKLATSMSIDAPLVYARFSSAPLHERLRVIERTPPSTARDALLCRLLRLSGDLSRAEALPEPDPPSGPAASELWHQRYQLAFAQSDYERAYSCARRALQAAASHPAVCARSRAAVAHVAVLSGHTSRAEQEYRALMRCPTIFDSFTGEIGLGYVALSRSEPRSVRRAAQSASEKVRLLPLGMAVAAWQQIALLWRELGEHDLLTETASAGLSLIEQGAGGLPYEASLHNLLGTGLLDQGRLDEAISELLDAAARFSALGLTERHTYAETVACAARTLRGERPPWPLDAPAGRAVHLAAAYAGVPRADSRTFADRTLDPRLHAVLDAMVGKPVSPDLLACSFEARLAVTLRAYQGSVVGPV